MAKSKLERVLEVIPRCAQKTGGRVFPDDIADESGIPVLEVFTIIQENREAVFEAINNTPEMRRLRV